MKSQNLKILLVRRMLQERFDYQEQLEAPSKSGIDKGKVSKLSIWDPMAIENTNFIGSCIVNYDRGWDIRPSKIAQPYFDEVKLLLDNFADQYINTYLCSTEPST